MTEARLFDRGYQTYEGPRTGVPGAARSLVLATVQRGLGLRRRGREKFFPFVVIGISFLPALVIIAMSVTLSNLAPLPEYSEYYNYIGLAILLFTAFVAPESVCTDRRSGLLSLYLASALTRSVYAGAKAGAVALILLLVTIAPLLLVVIGLSLTGAGPDDLLDAAKLVGRVFASGIIIALFFSSIAMSISSLTDRKAFASVGVIMLAVGTGIASGIIINAFDAPDWLQVIDLFALPFELVQRIFGEGRRPLGTPLVATATAAWALIGYGIFWIRYQRITVTR